MTSNRCGAERSWIEPPEDWIEPVDEAQLTHSKETFLKPTRLPKLTLKLVLIVLLGITYIILDTHSTYYAYQFQGYELSPVIRYFIPCWACIIGIKVVMFTLLVWVMSKVKSQRFVMSMYILVNIVAIFAVLSNYFHWIVY